MTKITLPNNSKSAKLISVKNNSEKTAQKWRVVLETILATNRVLYKRICRMLLYHLYRMGATGAEELIQEFDLARSGKRLETEVGENKPLPKADSEKLDEIREKTIEIASDFLGDEELSEMLLSWLREDRTSYLTDTLENPAVPLSEIEKSLERYFKLPEHERHLTHEQYMSLRVSLIKRFLSDSLNFVKVSMDHVTVKNFQELLPKMIGTKLGAGKTGGKGAGIFIAHRIIENAKKEHPILANVRVPNTWYLLSDAVLDFIHYNALEEITSFKYREIEEIRQEFQYFEQMFKHSQFSPEILKNLVLALEDMNDLPLIVRSSSLLEDSFEASFAGKYKSLFLANKGDMRERLDGLTDAISEVYASVLNPDAIQYRKERGLLHFREEMGCLIQEVVGRKVGRYFLPAFAGVAFSNNEIRWSSRIKREDGVARLVAGLGTRAVDRVAGDYPTLVSPGQPKLRVNTIPSEIEKYSQRYIDVINTETGEFETLEIKELLKEFGDEYPSLYQIVSVYRDEILEPAIPLTDLQDSNLVVTFNGLLTNTKFLGQIKLILNILADSLQTPVDVEFASDGENLYILQCRPQYTKQKTAIVKLPSNIPDDEIVFSADKYISEGLCEDISHIVYVSSDDYEKLDSRDKMLTVGKIVSELNSILPEKKFILMGPGRWGSRGDIKLGVSITYSGISKTCALIEIARKKQSYVPEVSFGTHFFQDLVESGIAYLPLYPDERNQIFNMEFLKHSENQLTEFVPWAGEFEDVVSVVDVQKSSNGKTLTLVMSADENKAIAYLKNSEKN